VWALGSLLIIVAAGWVLAGGRPIMVEYARLEGLRMVGGTRLTPEFAGILFGLVLYTGAFIADIVRAGLLAVPYGQLEAARAIGLNELQVLRFVILPQALRVIVPPLTNQYLNLAKNSSLAIAVGFPDLYAVSKVIFSQSGQAVQTIAMMMFTYLVISLVISAVMNVINARLRIVER
jgi:general L-amino acid transport system permease protein